MDEFTTRPPSEHGFFWVEKAIAEEYGAVIGRDGLSCYVALCSFADEDGRCVCTFDELASRAGFRSIAPVRRGVMALFRHNIIRMSERWSGGFQLLDRTERER